jgi:S-(hydroxymethyl)glutathione dehydrogenase/alcohol dehydrogenase
MVGVEGPRRRCLDPFVMSDSELKLMGSSYGSSTPAIDFRPLVDHYMHGGIDLDSLVTRVMDLEDINEGFDELKQGIGIHSVIKY